ncbi:hypothetical protein PM082_003851 [Marasmius tenuissimus]|nr:hypothetical protein PM082_003851 [Marasmius tenuissimus]
MAEPIDPDDAVTVRSIAILGTPTQHNSNGRLFFHDISKRRSRRSSYPILPSIILRDYTILRNSVDWEQHQFQAGTETNSRGSCPRLANRGFLPMMAKTLPSQWASTSIVINLLITIKAAIIALPLEDQFSLADIGLHSNIEHDTSVSRVDKELGERLSSTSKPTSSSSTLTSVSTTTTPPPPVSLNRSGSSNPKPKTPNLLKPSRSSKSGPGSRHFT